MKLLTEARIKAERLNHVLLPWEAGKPGKIALCSKCGRMAIAQDGDLDTLDSKKPYLYGNLFEARCPL